MTYPVFSGGINDTSAPVYPVARSVRFRGVGTANFTRTFGTPTSSSIYTFSAWVKRGDGLQGVGTPALIGVGGLQNLAFNTSNALVLTAGGSLVISPAVLRDPAAWYHIVWRRNGTSNTLYVNGVSAVTGTASSTINTAIAHTLGNTIAAGSNAFSGLMAYVYFVDGQALTPTSFGAYNSITGVWQPIKYTGTFGANGFFLPFTNNSSTTNLGLDSSGNGNNWQPSASMSVTAGVTYDSMLDVPTPTSVIQCNYPAINSISTVTTASVTGGGLETTSVASQVLLATMRMDTGKFYWEITFSAATSNQIVGVYKTSATAVTLTTGLTTTAIGVRFDANAGTLDYTTDGTNYTSISTGLTGGGYFPYAANTLGAKIIYVNFGQRPFSYTIPTGYGRLNNFQLSTPSIINPAKAFATTLYTGNGSTQTIANAVNGVSCYADFVWNKSRSNALNHYVYDTVRGLAANTNNQLLLTSGAASSTSGVTGFSSTGFSLGADSGSNTNLATYVSFQWNAGSGTNTWNFNGTLTRTATMTIASPCVVTLNTNGFSAGQAVQFTTTGALPTGVTSGTTYYAGNIATNTFNLYDTEANAITGGATGRVNTSGTQSGTQTCEHASKVSVNTTNGFSIVSYVGTGVATTVGHGQNQALDFIFAKAVNAIRNWPAYHRSIGAGNYLLFNGTALSTADTSVWDNTNPTSSVFSIGTNILTNTNGTTYIAYCFTSIPGFSSFGSYAGNGLAAGTFTYLGFLPRFTICKRTDNTTAAGWLMLNGASQVYNVQGPALFTESAGTEGTSTAYIDFLSNGFKQRSTNGALNAASTNYIYMAWAESPFKYSLAR